MTEIIFLEEGDLELQLPEEREVSFADERVEFRGHL